jgi:GxxExxY protein
VDFFEHRASLGERADPETERVASLVIGAAIEVHKHLGPGLPEAVYQNALCHELTLRSLPFESQAPVPAIYKGVSVGKGYVDLLVANCVVVELKAVEALTDVHRGQVIAYLSALKLRLGLLINFNVAALRQGLKRVVNDRISK